MWNGTALVINRLGDIMLEIESSYCLYSTMLLVSQLWYFIKEMPSLNACFDAAFLAVLQPLKHFLLE